jgi:hypothetical protein
MAFVIDDMLHKPNARRRGSRLGFSTIDPGAFGVDLRAQEPPRLSIALCALGHGIFSLKPLAAGVTQVVIAFQDDEKSHGSGEFIAIPQK